MHLSLFARILLVLSVGIAADSTLAQQADRAAETIPLSGPTAPYPGVNIGNPGNVGVSLSELEAMALANNPTLTKMQMKVRATEGVSLQSGLYPNPVVGYSGEDMGAEGTLGKQGAFVGQEFITGGKRQLAQSVAGHAVTEARRSLEIQRLRILSDVRIGFFDALVAQATVDLDEKLVDIGQKAVRTAEQLFDGLQVSQTDVLQAKIEADSARLKLEEARNRHATTWRRLAAVVGVPHFKPVRLHGDLHDNLPERSWEASVGRLIAESPELAFARSGVDRARCTLAHERSKRVPNVNLQAGVFHDNTINDTVTNIEVAMPLPIFDRNQGNICRAEAELIAAEKEVRRVELNLIDRLAVAFERYSTGRRRVEVYERSILPNAKESLDLVREGYRIEEINFLTLLTAQRTFFRASLNHLSSLREYRMAAIEIEGLLLRGGLQQTDGR